MKTETVLLFALFAGVLAIAGGDAYAAKTACDKTIAAVQSATTVAELNRALLDAGIRTDQDLTMALKEKILREMKDECKS